MIKFTGITFDPNFKQKAEAGFERKQKYIDSEVLRLSAPYNPFRQGNMIRSGTTGTVLGSGVVEYTAPYARKQYFTNSGRGREGINAVKGTKGLRGPFGFERMKADHKNEILEGAKKLK